MSEANRAVFVGEGSLLIRCAQAWREAGQAVVAVASAHPTVLGWSRDQGLPVERLDTTLRLPDVEFDYLFSVVNLRVLPDSVLRRARRLALNFHDGPLPRYAGLNAPAWALIAGESRHGVTWHEMTAAVDRGRIARQQVLPIAPDETTASLNARCWEAGYQTFVSLMEDILRGTLTLASQEGAVSCFGRHLRPANLGTLDWQLPATRLCALVRGLDCGAQPHPLALPKVWLGGRLARVRAAQVLEVMGDAPPGTVLELSAAAEGADARLVVATAHGALALQGLSALDARPALQGLAVGDVLPAIPAPARAALARDLPRLAKAEALWRRVLRDLPGTRLPYPRQPRAQASLAPSVATSRMLSVPLQAREAGATTLAGLCAWLSALSGEESVGVRYTDPVLLEQAGDLVPWASPWVPVVMHTHAHRPVRQACARADARVGQARQAGPMTADLRWRLGEGVACVPWPRLAVCLGASVPDTAGDDPPELLLHAPHPGAPLVVCVDSAEFSPKVIEWVARHLDIWLQAFGQAQGTVGDMLLAPAEELARIAGWNDTRVSVEAQDSVQAMIARYAQAHPGREALRCGGAFLTHAQLQALADRLAGTLRQRGVSPGDVVGICLDRSPTLVAAVLAVLACGAAYLPLDPAYPPQRLRFMRDDALARLVVCDATTQALQDLSPPQAVLADAPDEGEPGPWLSPPRFGGEQAAYVIYTSGSTGRPKGVVVTHANLLNFFAGMDARVPRARSGEGGRWLSVTSLSFDISVLELLWTLARGFSVVLAPGPQVKQAPQSDGTPQFSLFYFASDEAGAGDRYRLLMEGARFADTHGFCAVWTPERHFHAFGGAFPNPAITCAALAAATTRVQLRAGSCVLPLHHPARVAEDWAMVDNLSGGRVGVSFASGWQPRDFVLAPQAFAGRREALMAGIAMVRRLWRGEAVECPGPQGEPVAVRTLPRPVQPELPAWITAATNPETFEQAGQAGCHVLTHLLGQSVAELADKVARYRAAWRAAGHPGQGQVSVMVHTFIDDDAQAARRIARGPLKDYLRSAVDLIRQAAWTFPTFIERAAADGRTPLDILQAQPLSEAEMDALLEHAFDRYASSSALIGTPAQGLDLVRRLQAAGADEIACFVDFGIEADVVLAHLENLHGLMRMAQRPAQGEGLAVVARLVREERVTHLQCTPSMASLLVADETGRDALGCLDALLVGGEALSVPLARELRALVKGRLLAMYGPTETTVWSACAEVDAVGDFVPLGTPIANTWLHVRNAWGQECPALVPGELVIGGAGVCQGYLGKPELDAQRFFQDGAGGRAYRTGDLARRHPDGQLEFLGRMDHQVKIRGHRIELGEIEGVLLRQPGVAEAIVLDRRDDPGEVRLKAWVTPRPGSDRPQPEALLRALARELPPVMLPRSIRVLDRWPLTPNGKVDRNALSAATAAPVRSEPPKASAASPPSVSVPLPASSTGQAPTASLEEAVAMIWREVLGRADLARDANFFDLGGHSLAVVQVQRRLREATGVEVAMADMFRLTTITSLAHHLCGRSGAADRAVSEGLERAQARRALRPRPHAR